MSNQCDICRFEEPSHAPWCPAGRKPMEPPVDTFYIPWGNRMGKSTAAGSNDSVDSLVAELNKLKDENAKLRALVERGVKLMDADCGAQIDEFSYECREALK